MSDFIWLILIKDAFGRTQGAVGILFISYLLLPTFYKQEEISKRYGVKFVLGGGTQVSGGKTRINVELKDLEK